MKNGKFSHFLDGQDEIHSNWMRFVNCSRCEDEQNLVAYQFRGEIYYRTYKPVTPGKELLVWYGESYAKDLGISPCDNQDRSISKGIKPTGSMNWNLILSLYLFLLAVRLLQNIIMVQEILLYNRPSSRYSGSIHWLVHGHLTPNNEQVNM